MAARPIPENKERPVIFLKVGCRCTGPFDDVLSVTPMDKPIENSKELLHLSEKELLFGQLVAQLLKDFGRAGAILHISQEMGPEDVKQEVQKSMVQLYRHNYDAYLNVLYAIDVPERELAQVPTDQEGLMFEAITFLVLKREFQKVRLKSRYG